MWLKLPLHTRNDLYYSIRFIYFECDFSQVTRIHSQTAQEVGLYFPGTNWTSRSGFHQLTGCNARIISVRWEISETSVARGLDSV